jgi:methyl-accepting chemotaxis protein
LVEAVKEISQMIKEIFDTNDSQQEEIDELKRQVEELKTLIEKDS